MVLLSLSAACAWTGGVAAFAEIDRPAAAKRVVKTFDFEERPLNQEPAPMHWFRAQHDPPARERPGFPAWNAAGFDETTATSGRLSVKLPTRGGSTSLRLSSGVIAAIPGADYLIAANVRTSGLTRAGARLTARLVDQRRVSIPGTERHSEVVRTAGTWSEVSVELTGDHPGAAWIQIDLEVLQPIDQAGMRGVLPEDAVDRQKAWEEDYDGAAWFDDVVVYQLPRVELGTDVVGNLFTAPAKPRLVGSVRDLTGERLRARLTVTDIDGALIAREETEVNPGDGRLEWAISMPRYGWARARLDVLNDAGVVGRAGTTVLWLPSAGAGLRPKPGSGTPRVFEESGKFGLLAEEATIGQMRSAPDIAKAVGAGALTLSVWDRSLKASEARARVEELDEVVERCVAAGVGVTLAVGRVPDELTKSLRVDPDSALAVLGSAAPATGEAPWTPYLRDALSKFGQRVRRWQVGRTGDWSAFWRAGLGEELNRVERSFSRLVPRPTIAVPWAVDQKPDERLGKGRSLTVTLTPGVPESAVGAAVESMRSAGEPTVVVQPPDAAVFGMRASVNLLVRRAAAVWSAGAPAMALSRPWDWASAEGGASPRPELAAWRQLSERLGGRRVVGEMPVARGVRCLILDGAKGGALLAWNELAPRSEAVIRMNLGEGEITAYDPFGNGERVLFADGEHTLALDETPVFIEGADVPLARFRAGFRVEPGFIAAEATVHTVEIELANHWSTPINGVLRVTDPTGWKIEPRVIAFDIAPGQTRKYPVDLSFGVGEEAGLKRLRAEADIVADRTYNRVRLGTPVEVGLVTTQLLVTHAFVPDASGELLDVSVTLSITNTGDQAVSLQAFALAPGYPRDQAPVGSLGPGQTAVRRFMFPGGAGKLAGKRVRVGLVDVSGAGRLNKSVLIQ